VTSNGCLTGLSGGNGGMEPPPGLVTRHGCKQQHLAREINAALSGRRLVPAPDPRADACRAFPSARMVASEVETDRAPRE
jgi:hypothetical protein